MPTDSLNAADRELIERWISSQPEDAHAVLLGLLEDPPRRPAQVPPRFDAGPTFDAGDLRRTASLLAREACDLPAQGSLVYLYLLAKMLVRCGELATRVGLRHYATVRGERAAPAASDLDGYAHLAETALFFIQDPADIRDFEHACRADQPLPDILAWLRARAAWYAVEQVSVDGQSHWIPTAIDLET